MPVLLHPQLLKVELGDRVSADQVVIVVAAAILRKGVLPKEEPSPDRLLAAALCLLLRVLAVIVVGIGVGKHERQRPDVHVIGKPQGLHPGEQVLLLLPGESLIPLPGDKAPVVEEPVLRVIPLRFLIARRKRRVQKHELMVSHGAVHKRIGAVELLYIQERLNGLLPPVSEVPEEVERVAPVKPDPGLSDEAVQLVQRPMYITDCINCHSYSFEPSSGRRAA